MKEETEEGGGGRGGGIHKIHNIKTASQILRLDTFLDISPSRNIRGHGAGEGLYHALIQMPG